MPKLKNKPAFSARASISTAPETLDEKALTVDFTLSTEQPVRVMDWDTWDLIDEVLISSGVRTPRNGQVPLLDTHNAHSIGNILGSVRNIRIDEKGVAGTLHFSDNDAGREAFKMVQDGHLTDGSVGYQPTEYRKLKEGETFEANGKVYEGKAEGLKVVTAWRLFEFSLAPIGADNEAKVRADSTKQGENGLRSQSDENINKEGEEMPKKPEVRAEKPAQVDETKLNEVRAEAQKATIERMTTIRAEARALNLSAEEQDELVKCEDLSEARKLMIEKASKRTQAIEPKKVEMQADEADKFRRAATDGILLRAGVQVQNPAAGASSIRYGFKGLARECLERAGISCRGLSDEEILKRAINHRDFPAMSTSTFSYILKDASEKALLNGFNAMPTTYEAFCKIGSVSDFKTANRVRLSDAPSLETVNELGELPTKAFADAGATVAADTKGVIINISRRALINDDLNVLNDIPMAIGGKAAQQINAFAYSLLSGNKLSDGSACFTSAHGNLASSAGAPSAAMLAEIRKAMMQQTDIMGTKLNISPAHILVGPENYDALLVILGSEYMKGSTDAGNRNPYFNMAQPIVDANIEGAEWYAVANKIFPTIELVFLNGQRTPIIEELPQSEVLGVRLRAVLDFGGSLLDYRGLYKVPAS